MINKSRKEVINWNFVILAICTSAVRIYSVRKIKKVGEKIKKFKLSAQNISENLNHNRI